MRVLLPRPWDCHPCTWECPFARNVWSLFTGKTQKSSNQAEDFFLLFKQMQQNLSATELEKWTTVAWTIWNARNKFYFNHVQAHPKLIFEGAVGLLEEYERLLSAYRWCLRRCCLVFREMAPVLLSLSSLKRLLCLLGTPQSCCWFFPQFWFFFKNNCQFLTVPVFS